MVIAPDNDLEGTRRRHVKVANPTRGSLQYPPPMVQGLITQLVSTA